MPTLTLDPFGSAPKAELVPEEKQEAAKPEMAEARLTPEEMKMVDDFATQIDITDSNTVMTYGAATQQKMADFSDKALDNVR
ncbi:MAG: toxic anion resistance protein, partial [Lachnospiraceae bacterium]|nr:toxic anion resistance protein [Lachnospiraceae bacterium]